VIVAILLPMIVSSLILGVMLDKQLRAIFENRLEAGLKTFTKEEIDHVFDTFFRADSSNTAAEGTGLGLTIVRHIVNAHNGTILMDSKKGEGTTVTILLPIEHEQEM